MSLLYFLNVVKGDTCSSSRFATWQHGCIYHLFYLYLVCLIPTGIFNTKESKIFTNLWAMDAWLRTRLFQGSCQVILRPPKIYLRSKSCSTCQTLISSVIIYYYYYYYYYFVIRLITCALIYNDSKMITSLFLSWRNLAVQTLVYGGLRFLWGKLICPRNRRAWEPLT